MSILKTLFLSIFAYTVVANSLPARDRFPQVLAHRGASGYLPEHSLQAYQLSMDLETDYSEPDLCLTKDGIFVAMHDLLLDDTTDVAEHSEFDDRKTTKSVDGESITGYFVSDFTYSELLTLRLRQRLSGRSTLYDNFFQVSLLSGRVLAKFFFFEDITYNEQPY